VSAPTLSKFFLPGPTDVHPDVAAALMRPMISHRSSEFRALFARLQTGLHPFFATKQPVVLVPASATAMMEMAVRAAPPGRILALVNGAFSARFAEIARACGRDVDVQDVTLGRAPDLDDAERALARTRYAAVTACHCETSSGVMMDVRRLAECAHRHGALALIDAVTSVGGTECATDAWALDFVFAGSQKTLALPPGLALAVAAPSLVESARANPGRGRYLDVDEYVGFATKSETPNTPSLALLHALDAQLERIAREGLSARLARHAAMAAATHAWVDRMRQEGVNVGVLAPAGLRSPTVSVLTLPEGATAAKVLRAMTERGYTLGAGFAPLAKSSVRIGHMGDHTVEGVTQCLAELEDVLRTAAVSRAG
jgi:aspartate aminotransferase-like enzyme